MSISIKVSSAVLEQFRLTPLDLGIQMKGQKCRRLIIIGKIEICFSLFVLNNGSEGLVRRYRELPNSVPENEFQEILFSFCPAFSLILIVTHYKKIFV